MTWIIEFLQSIFGTINAIVSLIISTFESLINFLVSLPMFISTITSVIGIVPSTILFFITLTITISVILLIIGRENKQ